MDKFGDLWRSRTTIDFFPFGSRSKYYSCEQWRQLNHKLTELFHCFCSYLYRRRYSGFMKATFVQIKLRLQLYSV